MIRFGSRSAWVGVAWTGLLLVPCASSLAASFTRLGILEGYASSSARAVAADGMVVAGLSEHPSLGPQATRWSSSGGLTGLGDLVGGPIFSDAFGISADGSLVAGTGTVSPIVTGFRSYLWSAGTGMVELTGLPADVWYSTSVGLSADGATVVGNNQIINGASIAYLWTAAGGFTSLTGTAANPAVPYHTAAGISPGGQMVVGTAAFFGGASQAFYWTASSGFVRLGDLAGGSPISSARAVSTNEQVIVGQGNSASGPEAFRWTPATGLEGLGDLAGGDFWSEATGVSANGSVIVGTSNSATGDQAFVWTAAAGMRPLRDILLEQGATGLDDYRLASAWGISADGQWIVGDAWSDATGQRQGYRAQIAFVPDADADGIPDASDNCTLVVNQDQLDADTDGYGNLCDADLDNNGLTTAADYGLLRSCLNLAAVTSPVCAAGDMNGDGVVTAADYGLLRARLNTTPGPSGLHP